MPNKMVAIPLLQQADSLREKALRLIKEASPEERFAWFDSALTQGIALLVQAEIAEAAFKWVNGQFTDSSDSGTIQLNSGAIGRVGALESVLQMFDSLHGGDE